MVKESFHYDYFIKLFPKLIKVIPLSLMMAISAIIIGCLAGLLITTIKVSKHRVLSSIFNYLTVIIRAIPEVVIIYLVYFGIPTLVKSLSGYNMNNWQKPTFMIMALSISLSASSSELFRSAYYALDKGQLEAAHSLGMTRLQRFFRIILPQGLFVILPNLSGLSLGIIQATSLSYTLGIIDIMGKARVLDTNSFGMNTFESYLVVALIYWAIAIVEGYIFKLLEKLIGRGMRTVATASN